MEKDSKPEKSTEEKIFLQRDLDLYVMNGTY